MITRRETMKAFGAMMAAAVPALASMRALAEAPPSAKRSAGREKRSRVHVVLQQPLPDMKGKVATLVTVSYAPGAASLSHRHPGPVFGYVLEGSVVMQFEPKPPVTYTVGQAFYEAPMHVHRISRNASNARPAEILAFQITNEGQPLTLPVT